MANNDMDRVVPLGQLDDFKVAEGDPDVRGWEVLASDGRKIGEVDELLVDTSAMKVRYLDVDVDDGVIGDGMDRHVLIPIGYARLEQERDCVMVDGLASADLGALPAYDQGPLTRDFESSVRSSFAHRGPTTGAAGMTGAGAGMMDTAGMDNTPGTGTGLGMTGAAGLTDPMGTGARSEPGRLGNDVPDGEGMRAAGYDLGGGTTGSPRSTHSTGGVDAGSTHTGSMSAGASGAGPELRDTGSPRTGTDSELGVRSSGSVHGGGMVAPTEGSTERGGMSAGSTGGGLGSGGNAPMSAGGQGPVSGMNTGLEPHGDVSHRSSGMAGSDYLHNADEDFYASDAFDDSRFYGARRGGQTGDVGGGGMGTGAGSDLSRGGGMGGTDSGMRADATGTSSGDGSASREEVSRLAREASERLSEDHRNRGVGGSGNR